MNPLKLGFLFVMLCGLAQAADFETGTVQASTADLYSNNIPQIARLGDGRLFTVWCARPDVKGAREHIYGSFSSDGGRTWSAARLLISDSAKADGDPNILADGNKVFVFSTRANSPNKIDKSWIIAIHSDDNGRTWSGQSEIFVPRQYMAGKQANGIVLRNGTYLMGVSWDKWAEMGMAARTEGEMELTTGVLLSRDGAHWTLHGAIHTFVEKVTPGSTNGLCEPSFVQLADGSIFMLLRSGSGHHYECRSTDGGVTWDKPKPSSLSGHNTPSALWRLDQHPEEIVVVWNDAPMTRYPLSTAISADGGKTWSAPKILAGQRENLQVSYPGVTQATDHAIVAVWQQQLPGGGFDIRWARYSRDWVLR